jgi:glycosyltransferase involved in cell wall biosynthesis
MKVLLITEYFPPIIQGGGELSASLLAEELAKNKVETHVLTSHFPGLQEQEEINGVIIHRNLKTGLNPKKIIDNIKRIMFLQKSIKEQAKKLDKEYNFDVIHFLNTTSITKLNIKTKKIATINNYTNFCPKSNLYHKKIKWKPGEKNFKKYLKMMLTSDYVGKQKLKPYLKYNPIFLIWLYLNYLKRRKQIKYVDTFIVLNNIIKLNNSKKIYNLANIPTKVEEYPIKLEKNKVKILYSGYLETIKGVDLLIRSISKIENIQLIVLGSGSEENNLKDLVKRLNIESKVIFTGKVDYKYIPFFYKNSDIVVLPTRWPEPFSRNILEATFFGKPIVASKTGGNPEGITNNGFLVNNTRELTEKLQTLTKDKKLREKMGKASKKLYKEKFDPKKLIKETIEFYKE